MGFSSYLLTLSAIAGALAAPSAVIDERSPELARRSDTINYNQNYIASGANVQYSPNLGAGTFSISYNTQQDFVCGIGWQPGNSE